MSFCQLCKLKIKLLYYCSLCRSQFCNTNCLINHITSKHSKKLITGKNLTISNSNENLTKFSSKGYIINIKPYRLTKDEFKEFEILKQNNSDYQIGLGAFSKVYLGKHIPTKELYAIKKISKKELISRIDSIEIINREIELHSKLFHKNIIHLVAIYENEEFIYIILEYLNKGDLYKLIRKKQINKENQCYSYFIQIVNAVLFLHENNLIHRDIKPENILLNDNNEIKLCDFGCCAESGIGNRTTFCGTYEYMAPEILKENSYNNSVDIWSLGILLYELSHGYTPFNFNYNGKKNQESVFKDIIKGNFNFKKDMIFISDEFIELMMRMIVYNPNKRIKIRDIFKSQLINKFEGKKEIDINKSFNLNFKRLNSIDKDKNENASLNNKLLSERREKKHVKCLSMEKFLSGRNSNNGTVISELRKSQTKKFEKEDSLYSDLKKSKKISLNTKQIQNLSSIKPQNKNQKLNKQLSAYNSYITNKIKYQRSINLCDKSLNNESTGLSVKKVNNTNLSRKKENKISTNKSLSQMKFIDISNSNNQNNINNSNNINNEKKKRQILQKHPHHGSSEDIKVFSQLFQDENEVNEIRKTKMKNVNGVNISSKLIDVLDIFNRVEKLKKSNQNLSFFQKFFQNNK